MRRSKRAGVQKAKQRVKATYEYLNAPDRKVLSGALPSPNEIVTTREFNSKKDRLKPSRRVQLALERPQSKNPLLQTSVGSDRRHILFLNVGDEPILDAIRALQRGTAAPPWMKYLHNVTAEKGKLYHSQGGQRLPFAFRDDKRQAVKQLYFNPKEPSTIQPITDVLREKYCNVSRRNVRDILRSLQTYQLMFPRRKPPDKIPHSTNYTKPGVIAMDTFFPSSNSGWVKRAGGVLCCMDVWSRFSRAYALEKKEAAYFETAMKAFLSEFTSLGHLPRRLLTDKGSELAVGTALIEKYRLPRDGDAVMHLKSFTGTPVQVVEAMNAQYQRRLEAYRIAELHDDPADLLWDISEQLNNQKRQRRGNLTPYQLLDLNDRERNTLNSQYKNVHGIGLVGQKKLPLLQVGDHVRKLEMTFKEQVKGSKKGFQEKWSRKKYQVLRRTALRRNPGVHRYSIGDPKRTYYRHELLLIPRETDQEVLVFPTSAPFLVEDSYTPP